MLDGRPGRGIGAAGTGAEQGGGGEDAARPVRVHEHLVLEQIQAAVGDGRGALGGVAVLVDVGGDGGHPRHPVVPQRQRLAVLLHEGQDEAAHAGVHVQRHAALLGDAAHGLDRIYGAVRIARRGAQHHHRVAVDQPRQARDVGFQISSQRQQPDLDAEILRGLEPGNMGARRQHHLRPAYPPSGACQVAVGLDRQQAALGAAGGDHAAGIRRPVVELGDGGDDFRLEALEALEGRRVQAVGRGVGLVGLGQESVVLLAEVIDQAPEPAGLVVGILPAESGELLQDFLARPAGFGHGLVHGVFFPPATTAAGRG